MKQQHLTWSGFWLMIACSAQQTPQIGSSRESHGDAAPQTPDEQTYQMTSRCSTAVPSYRTEIVPILTRSCLGCHGTQGSEAEEAPLYRYEPLLARRQLLVGRLTTRSMPPTDAPALPEADRLRLVCWAHLGAPNN